MILHLGSGNFCFFDGVVFVGAKLYDLSLVDWMFLDEVGQCIFSFLSSLIGFCISLDIVRVLPIFIGESGFSM